MNDSIVFYRSFAEALSELPPEQYKDAMLAILNYGLDGVEPDQCTGITKVIFALIKPQLDANSKRRENSGKGGRPKSKKPMVLDNDKTEKPMVSTFAQNSKPNVNVNDNDNVNVNDKRERESFAPPTRAQVIEYMTERKGASYATKEAESFVDYYASKGWTVGQTPMTDWRSAVNRWIKRDEDGKSQPTARSGTSKSKFSNFKERDYDMASLEMSLINQA